MPKKEHAAILDKGVAAWNRWAKRLDPNVKPNLEGLDLAGLDLSVLLPAG